MTPKKEIGSDLAATVNWNRIAKFLGQPSANVERLRKMQLTPAVSDAPLPPTKR